MGAAIAMATSAAMQEDAARRDDADLASLLTFILLTFITASPAPFHLRES